MPGTAAGNGLGASPCAGSQKTCPIGQFMAEPGQTRTFHVTEPVPAPSMPQTAHGARQATDHDPPTDQSPQAGPRSLQGNRKLVLEGKRWSGSVNLGGHMNM